MIDYNDLMPHEEMELEQQESYSMDMHEKFGPKVAEAMMEAQRDLKEAEERTRDQLYKIERVARGIKDKTAPECCGQEMVGHLEEWFDNDGFSEDRAFYGCEAQSDDSKYQNDAVIWLCEACGEKNWED